MRAGRHRIGLPQLSRHMSPAVSRLALGIGLWTAVTTAPALGATTEMAAGCYLPLDDGVVLTINRLTKTVQLPIGGVETGESMEQTAARETLEEIGVDVEVGNRLLTLREGRVAIFVCSPKSPIKTYESLKAIDTNEVGEILVLNPHTLVNYDGRKISNRWRHPPLRFLLRALFSPTRASALESDSGN